jgi:hypothetical protein
MVTAVGFGLKCLKCDIDASLLICTLLLNLKSNSHVFTNNTVLSMCESLRTSQLEQNLNKMKRNHVYDFSSYYSDTFPLILVLFAAVY